MRIIKRKRKQIEKIIVSLIDEKRGVISEIREYIIPENGSYAIETIGGDLKIFDQDGDICNRVNWQAGFSQEYEFFYKESN